MSQERLSRILLCGLIVLFLLVRAFFTLKFRAGGGKSPTGVHSVAHERRASFIIRRFIIVPALSVSFFLYYTNPSWMKLVSIPLSASGIYVGAMLGVCGILFLIWVHIYLGKEWSAKLQVRSDHHLVQSGPYSRIRHPMYTALFAIYLSIGIVSSNYPILILMAMAIISIAMRIPKEEEMLIERFGEEYRSYR